jgi:hypothetical protein
MACRELPRFALFAQASAVAAALLASSSGFAAIYSCVDGNGRRLTSDRPIPECLAREQRLLNADGSVKQVVPPTMTVDELAEAEAKKRQAELERTARQDAVRRDRNLLSRFPNEAAHAKAREAALDDVRKGVKFSEERLVELEKARKPLLDETEFYKGKKLPLKLRQQLDANEAAASAQRSLVQNQKDEIRRIDSLYDAELDRLKKLWSGVPAGSLPLPASSPPTSSLAKPAGK